MQAGKGDDSHAVFNVLKARFFKGEATYFIFVKITLLFHEFYDIRIRKLTCHKY